MASKRKSKGSAPATPSNKRQRASATPKKKVVKPVNLTGLYSSILKQVLTLKDKEDERELAAPFIKLPSKKLYPDYFTIVPNPFTISDIQKKVSRAKYSKTDSSEFVEDFKKISENAALYNDPDSWIVGDAEEILDFVNDKLSEGAVEEDDDADDAAADEEEVDEAEVGEDGQEDGEEDEEDEEDEDNEEEVRKPPPKLSLKLKKPKGRPSNAEKAERAAAAAAAAAAALESTEELTLADLPELTTILIKAVRDHKFPGLGLLSEPFLDDIDRRDYPDYFKIIQHPTSFNRVLAAIKKKGYFNPKKSMEENLSQFYEDTTLIFSNAQLYNDPSSLIHQDSVKLQEVFEEKFDLLKERAKPKKLKLKLKQPAPEEKLTLKIERRGRKKKSVGEIKVESEAGEENDDVEVESAEEEEGSEEDGINSEDDVDNGDDSKPILQAEYNTMGKISSQPNPKESFIQSVSLCSSSNTITALQQMAQQGQQQQQQQGFQTLANLTKSKQLKYTLFPSHAPIPNAILFEYKFPSRGFADSSYTLTLPHDSTSLVSLKISLHELFSDLKKSYLVNNHGFVNSTNDEDFQCRLFLNDEEVNTGGEIYEGEKEDDKFLNFQYDLKLSQGLNILSFELKVSPSLGKKIKKDDQDQGEDQDEGTGRHTRHQLQQMKMTWDVEKINFIICNNFN
ncbi:hypothetical protein CLIB1423_16S01596 [[Candida] railenensis]|uniref:Bromo domain-containing protein n=1 Tax=[Candida] railenensis TaxID=45579 RepID=A0A9P0VZX5_9ASCO|nr:hypothetical protein CLIB1423_16S01596 [[Candida] railenensis]